MHLLIVLQIFVSETGLRKMDYIWDIPGNHQTLHIHGHVDNRSGWPFLYTVPKVDTLT